MKTIKSLFISFIITILLVTNGYALNWNYDSFAYWNSNKVVFTWSKYDKENKYNNFDYYEVIRTDTKENSSAVLFKSYTRSENKFIDNNPLLGKWSLYKTCTRTTDNRRFCTKPHKIYVAFNNWNQNNVVSNNVINNNPINNNFVNNGFSNNYNTSSNNKNLTFSSHNYKNYYPYNDRACPAVEQPASNPQTWECRVYSNPCQVPVGWKNVATCNIDDNELSLSMKRRIKTIILKFVDRVVNENIEDYKKLDILKKSLTRFQSVSNRDDTRLSYVAQYSAEVLENEYNRYSRDYSLDTWIYYQMNEFLNWSY